MYRSIKTSLPSKDYVVKNPSNGEYLGKGFTCSPKSKYKLKLINGDFDRDANKINAKKASIDNVANQVQDLLSVYYWTRVWDVKNAKVGDTYPTVFYMDGKVYNYAIKYLGKEVVKIDAGKFNAIKIRPQVKTGDFFKNEDALTIWVSDDDNHMVLKVESEIFVGAVAMTLTDYKNLKNPVTSKIK
jgi:hypothetical protein